MSELDKVNDTIIKRLEEQGEIKNDIIASLRASNEYLLEKLVKLDIENELIKNELETLK